MAVKKIFGKTVAVIFMLAHGFYFIQSLIFSLAFFNHFSNAGELENGLGAILHAILHAGCFYLGLCLFYGTREDDKILLLTFLIPASILTVLSLLYLLTVSIFYLITVLQMISWSLHILFYSIVILLIGTIWSSIPATISPGLSDPESSPQDGMVQEARAPTSGKNSLLGHIMKDWELLVVGGGAKISGFFGGIFQPKSNKKGKDGIDGAGIPGLENDFVYDSDNSDSDNDKF